MDDGSSRCFTLSDECLTFSLFFNDFFQMSFSRKSVASKQAGAHTSGRPRTRQKERAKKRGGGKNSAIHEFRSTLFLTPWSMQKLYKSIHAMQSYQVKVIPGAKTLKVNPGNAIIPSNAP